MKTIRPAVKIDSDENVTKGEAAQWRLNVPGTFNNGKKQRLFFATKTASENKRAELLSNRAKPIGEEQLAKLAARGLTIESAIQYAIDHAPTVADKTLGKLIDEYITHRVEEVGVGERYLATLNSYAKILKAEFGSLNLRDVTKAQVRKFLAGLKARDGQNPASPDTRNHYLETLNALYNYAKTERYLAFSPTEGISKTKTDGEEIEILSVEDAAKLLEALALPEHIEVAPGALLQLFAGPRRSEMMHVPWAVVQEKFLRLDIVKVGTKNRSVELPEALREWIGPHRKLSGYVFEPSDVKVDRECLSIENKKKRKKAVKNAIQTLEDAYGWRISQAAKSAGITLPKNVLRHTAITYRLNLTGDIAATALWAGNSPGVIRSSYLGKATEDDAKRFYNLKPAPDQSSKTMEVKVE
jgi:site-specific recombinase XerD